VSISFFKLNLPAEVCVNLVLKLIIETKWWTTQERKMKNKEFGHFYYPTPRSGVILEKLIVSQLVKKLPPPFVEPEYLVTCSEGPVTELSCVRRILWHYFNIILPCTHIESRDSYGLDGWSSNPGRIEILLFSTASRPALGAHQAFYSMRTGDHFPGDKVADAWS
jgi:hypothetical protein